MSGQCAIILKASLSITPSDAEINGLSRNDHMEMNESGKVIDKALKKKVCNQCCAINWIVSSGSAYPPTEASNLTKNKLLHGINVKSFFWHTWVLLNWLVSKAYIAISRKESVV